MLFFSAIFEVELIPRALGELKQIRLKHFNSLTIKKLTKSYQKSYQKEAVSPSKKSDLRKLFCQVWSK